MQVKATFDDIISTFRRMDANMDDFLKDTLEEVSLGVEVELKNRILDYQITPDGHEQQKNQPSTVARKQRAGRTYNGQVTPLYDSGRMVRAKWRGKATHKRVKISLPAYRKGTVYDSLLAKGYRFFSLPTTVDGQLLSNFMQLTAQETFKKWMYRGR